MTLKNTLLHHLNAYPAACYWVGFSGGRDSHVLLDLLCQLRDSGKLPMRLAAIHINHGLNTQSSQWVHHCQTVCRDYGITLFVETVTEKPSIGESIEAFARTQRYALIEPHLSDGDIFLSAHHQRDQAETVLLQLMRGAGLHGLQAMPMIKPFGAGQYLRPLLAANYADIEDYATDNHLNFITDDSNADTRFNRNYIRHEVLPVLKQRFPQAEQSIARSAAWLSEIPTPKVPKKLHIPTLQQLSIAAQKQQIRDYCKAKTGQALSKTQTDYLLKHHLAAKQDKHPQLNVGDYVIRRFQEELVITVAVPISPLLLQKGAVKFSRHCEVRGGVGANLCVRPGRKNSDLFDYFAPPARGRHIGLPLQIQHLTISPDERGKLEINHNAECTVGTDYPLFLPHLESEKNAADKTYFGKFTWHAGQGGLPLKTYQLKPLQGAMRFQPHTRTYSSTVKKLLHEAGIAPWLRPLWLGLFDGEVLVAIPNVGVAKTVFQKSENAMIPIWQIEEKFVKL